MHPLVPLAGLPLALVLLAGAHSGAQDPPVVDPLPEGMKAYTLELAGSDISFEFVAIPGGEFTMGSPEDEPGRDDHEGPQRRVRVSPFWMQKLEITWEQYEAWAFELEVARRPDGYEASDNDEKADGVTRPTPPYTDMTFDMGHDGYPAICMTQKAAKTFCEWLSAKTGHTYRLPTEAEWEWACRAGTETPYSFGSEVDELGTYAWFVDNADEQYQKVGRKKPNPWGLHDMHGNVAEWCLDALADYQAADGLIRDPVVEPEELYGRVVRGGSWKDDPELLRSAARVASHPMWKMRDPQIPQSVWYHTDAQHVGFRIVRPYRAKKKP